MADDITGPEFSAPVPLTEVGDFAGLGKAVGQFLMHVARATGVLYRPKAIRDQGQAKADVKRFEADAKAYEIVRIAAARAEAAEIKDDMQHAMEEKAIARLRTKALRQQMNFDDIVLGTANRLGNEESTSFDEDDWLVKFMDYAQDISDPKLQSVWSELLARKMTDARRSVSLMTLDAIRLLEPRQAALFDEITRCITTFGFYYWTLPNLDRSGGKETYSDVHVAKVYDDLDVLEELRFVSIQKNEPPEPGKAIVTFTPRFVLKIQRASRKAGHVHFKDISRGVKGSELTRVILMTSKEEDLLPIHELNSDEERAYKYMSPEQQADALTRMFKYLWDCNYDCIVGGKTGSFPWGVTHIWDGSALAPLTDLSEHGALPPELTQLLRTTSA